MTKEEIYIAALDNCLGRKNDNLEWENCHKCPYFGLCNCQDELREGIACNTNPDAFIAAGLITKGYIKSDYYPTYAAISYENVYLKPSLKPFDDYTQKVEWLGDTYFTIPEKEIIYEIYDENNCIVYSASTIDEAEEYIDNLQIKTVER